MGIAFQGVLPYTTGSLRLGTLFWCAVMAACLLQTKIRGVLLFCLTVRGMRLSRCTQKDKEWTSTWEGMRVVHVPRGPCLTSLAKSRIERATVSGWHFLVSNHEAYGTGTYMCEYSIFVRARGRRRPPPAARRRASLLVRAGDPGMVPKFMSSIEILRSEPRISVLK